jgi:biopolymer transport protein ExbB/TolQ
MSGDRLGDALAQIAAALEVPVLLAAVVVLLLCAVELGRFATELWTRRRAGAAPTAFAAVAATRIAAARRAGRPQAVEHALADYELAAQKRLDRTRLLVRAGPAIGLMGTLIPLAPGLAALGRGDVAALAADLRVAFSATVIGLLVGTVAFALTLTRTRMYSADLATLERAAEEEAADSAAPAAPTPEVAA